MKKTTDKVERGDWQTPPELAQCVCRLVRQFIDPDVILEPNCGQGAFVLAAAKAFPNVKRIWAGDVNGEYVHAVAQFNDRRITAQKVDFFSGRWKQVLNSQNGSVLIIGNPPWVTNSELARLNSGNVPQKENTENLAGIDALTGKSNFDISEWMMVEEVKALQGRCGVLAMLCKTSVSRKVLRFIWKNALTYASASIYKIDAKRFFDVSVEACLLLIQFKPETDALLVPCPVYDSLESDQSSQTIALRNGTLVNDAAFTDSFPELFQPDVTQPLWRSGVKHDCSKVLELTRIDDDVYLNKLGEQTTLEPLYVYPLLKSSDVANRRVEPIRRFLLVPQTRVGQNVERLQHDAPLTWTYLQNHLDYFQNRKSAVYNKQTPFSIFGIGDYAFAPWKAAISGLYRTLSFQVVGPYERRPVVFDDTCYFLPCQTKRQALLVKQILDSPIAVSALNALIFWDSKRPIKCEVLNRLNLFELAKQIGQEREYPTAFRLHDNA